MGCLHVVVNVLVDPAVVAGAAIGEAIVVKVGVADGRALVERGFIFSIQCEEVADGSAEAEVHFPGRADAIVKAACVEV